MYSTDFPFYIFFIFFIGASVGSFLNVVADRLPFGHTLMGRSHCDFCKRTLSAHELVPIMSFFVQRGRTACCHKKLSIQYPLVEGLTGVLFVLFFLKHAAFTGALLFDLIIISCLIALTVADIKYFIIPDEVLVVMVASGILYHYASLPQFLGGAVFGAFLLWLIYHFSSGTAMGFGDVKLIFAAGIALPFVYLLLSLYVGFLTGGVVSAILLLSKLKKPKSAVPFGPFIAIGIACALWYLP